MYRHPVIATVRIAVPTYLLCLPEQFYSLVCRDLLKKGLGIWRGDDSLPSPPQRLPPASAARPRTGDDSNTSPATTANSSRGRSSKPGSAGRGGGCGGGGSSSGVPRSGVDGEETESDLGVEEEKKGEGRAEAEVEDGAGVDGSNMEDDAEEPYLEVGPEGLFPAPLDERNKELCTAVEGRFT